MTVPLPVREDHPHKQPEGPARTAGRRGRAQQELLLPRLLPGAQPLFCALFLIAARITAGIAGDAAATPLYVVAYLTGGAGSAIAAWRALRRLRIDVNLLMLLAAAGAASV